jgi:hypothetical protein
LQQCSSSLFLESNVHLFVFIFIFQPSNDVVDIEISYGNILFADKKNRRKKTLPLNLVALIGFVSCKKGHSLGDLEG